MKSRGQWSGVDSLCAAAGLEASVGSCGPGVFGSLRSTQEQPK